MSSEAQINANRANSQHSTGPKTEEGKAVSSLNAVKSALTGRTIMLPGDDVPRYEKLAQEMINFHKPADYMEGLLVQSLTDTEWRLQRIPALESALWAMGYRDLENAAFIDAENIGSQIEMRYERQFRNLRLQETRLRRMYREDLARLAEIQAARKEAAEAAAEAEAEKETSVPQKPASAPATGEQTGPSKIGFEFSTAPKPPEKAA